jgi:hypothetical protein
MLTDNVGNNSTKLSGRNTPEKEAIIIYTLSQKNLAALEDPAAEKFK